MASPAGPPCSCGHLCSRAYGVGACPCRARGERCQYLCRCGTSTKSCRNSDPGSNSKPPRGGDSGKAYSQTGWAREESNFFSSASNNSSKSVHLRQTGNEHYRAAFNPRQDLDVSKGHIEKALQCFQQALTAAETPEEMSSAAQNIGFSAWKLAQIQKDLEKPLMTVSSSFQLAFNHLEKAINFGSQRGEDWVNGVRDSAARCLESAINFATETLQDVQRAKFLEELLDMVESNKLKAICYLAIAKALFSGAVEALQSEENYKTALSLLHDCHYPLEESARLNQRDFMHEAKVNELRAEITSNLSIAESIQARKIGDSILKKALEDEEDLNIDWVWEAVDWYKKAIILTREKQVESEAAALSRLGSLFYKVLKLKSKAKENFMRCMQLALAMTPRFPENEEWFKVCKETLNALQQEFADEEEAEKQPEREKYHKMLETEMVDLKRLYTEWNSSSLDKDMLTYIYKTYPPTNKNHQMVFSKRKEWDADIKKKALLKAIQHYHPDKVDVDVHGLKMKYLSEEVTKVLTNRYENAKMR